jgi:hypothetical protein
MSNKSSKSDFLFAQPSFLSGMARALDLSGTFDAYNRSRNGGEADLRAIWSDWLTVGQDMSEAINSEKDKAA